MAKIDVCPNELTSLRAKLASAAALIEDAEQLTASALQNLDLEVAAKEGIRTSLSQLKNGLERQNSKVNSLAEYAALAAGKFQEADSLTAKASDRIAKKIVEPVSVSNAGVRDFVRSVQISRTAVTGGLFLASGSVLAKSSGGKTRLQRIADSVQASLATFMRKILDVIRKTQEKKPVEPVKEPVKPGKKVVGPSTSTSSSYQVANHLGMTYYTQGKNKKGQVYNKHWDASVWKVYDKNGKVTADYSDKRSVSCDICCSSMIASYFGYEMTPGQWYEANGGKGGWFKGAHSKMEKDIGLVHKQAVSKSTPIEKRQGILDDYLDKYLNDPDQYAPPMVGFYKGEAQHYVLVVGKKENGDYIIIDPANDERTTLRVKQEKSGTVLKDKKSKTTIGYDAGIKDVVVWEKK